MFQLPGPSIPYQGNGWTGAAQGFQQGIQNYQQQESLNIQRQQLQLQQQAQEQQAIAQQQTAQDAEANTTLLRQALAQQKASDNLNAIPNQAQPSRKAKGIDPSLDETIDWLISKLDQHRFVNSERDQYTLTITKLEYRATRVKAANCQMQIANSIYFWLVPGMPAPVEAAELDIVDFGNVSMSDLTCSSEKKGNLRLEIKPFTGSFASYTFKKDSKTPDQSETKDIKIMFKAEEGDLCGRIINATKHAAQLCGAKSEPF